MFVCLPQSSHTLCFPVPSRLSRVIFIPDPLLPVQPLSQTSWWPHHHHLLDPVAGGAEGGSGNTVAFIPLSKIGNLILPALSTEYKSTLLMGDSRPSTTWPLSAVTPCAPHKLVPEDLVAFTLGAPLLCPHAPTASLTSTPEKSLLPLTVLPLSYLLVSALISLAFIFLVSLSDSSGDNDQAFFLSDH